MSQSQENVETEGWKDGRIEKQKDKQADPNSQDPSGHSQGSNYRTYLVNEWMNKQTNEPTNKRMIEHKWNYRNYLVNKWMDKRTNEPTNKRMIEHK